MSPWLRDGWYLPWFAVHALCLVIIWKFKRKSGPGWHAIMLIELAAIRAAQDARFITLQLGREQALAHVRDKYAAIYRELARDVARRVKEVEHDPEALAKVLERATRFGALNSPQAGPGGREAL